MPLIDDELKNKVEALLFSVGKRVDINELAKLVRCKEIESVEAVLKDLQKTYDERNSPMIIVNDGQHWKIVVREKYGHVVKKVVADVELSKTLMETLALVAWKNPMKQSEVIDIRSNKGYDHLDELERIGFITRKKFGRTKLISLTEKFFNYFELSGHEDIKEAFKRIKELEEKKMQEYAQKKADADMKRKHSDQVKVINQKSFLDRVDRQLGADLKKEEIKSEMPTLEQDIKQAEAEKIGEFEKEMGTPSSEKEEEKGIDLEITEEAKDKEYYEDKLDSEGMPDLNTDKDDEEEEVIDSEQEEKKKKE